MTDEITVTPDRRHSSDQGAWKTAAAYVYILICIFDFLIMPAYMVYNNRDFSEKVISIMDESNRKYALDIIDRLSLRNWEPVTVYGGGVIFHIAFGAILTGAAVTDRRWTLTSTANKKE